jgi:5-oxoprolinase (ATP-hydrolysing)
MTRNIKIAIDRGGTFTDIHSAIPGQPDLVFKLLSVDPSNYKDAPTEGIRRVLEHAHCISIPKDQLLELDTIESIKMGTTVATNALLERDGAKVALVTSRGFRDVLEIGNQTRPDIFNISARKLDQLYTKVIEIGERITLPNYTEGGGAKVKVTMADQEKYNNQLVEGITGDVLQILEKPDLSEVKAQLQQLKDEGFSNLAICLLHSYLYPTHEAEVSELARSMGFEVSVSVELQPVMGIVNRCSSAVADAYLSPKIQEYLQGFSAGFKGGLEAMGNKLLFMQSNGGLCRWDKFTGLRAVLSGPAGGVVGYAETCFDRRPENKKASLGFDMGGTSTDVSRFSGRYEHVFTNIVNQIHLSTPQLDISTVAAGGGSMLFWKNSMFVVGPESAGAHPGPACYRKGGPLTITDANVFTGRLLPEFFPKIFGPNENEPLDIEITKEKFSELTNLINEDIEAKLTPHEVALGFLKVANEAMCRPIRTLTEGKGYSTHDHNLSVFGGAGGQHCCSVARTLNIENVVIHKYSSLLSAYGISLADVVIEKQQPISLTLAEENMDHINTQIDSLISVVSDEYLKQKTGDDVTTVETYLNLKYEGTDTCLMVLKPENGDFKASFVAQHQQDFGFSLERDIVVEGARVRLVVSSGEKLVTNPFEEVEKVTQLSEPVPIKMTDVWFENSGVRASKVFLLKPLETGVVISGPAIIIDDTQTILVEPDSIAHILTQSVLIKVSKAQAPKLSSVVVDPVQLSVFGHRFMSIAEQMGKTLQMTAISTNIKERLDFSCALFDGNGKLLANAPHIPGHLGSMFLAVEKQNEMWKDKLKPGDVLVANHPSTGGTHLPDITVLTPVLDKNNDVLFWTASRGHHADIGGISPGSMPSDSKEIWQEGAAIESDKLYDEGVFQHEKMVDLLYHQPSKYPGCEGSRALEDNISDLKAHASANYRGIKLLQGLIDDFSYDVVKLYMDATQEAAEVAVRNLLQVAYDRFGGEPMSAVDYLDDGTAIAVTVTVNREDGSAVLDFTESGEQFYSNLNCPIAVLYGSILYVLRCLINVDIPLNSGCMAPLDIRVREGSLFKPSYDAATVGSNVETAQRISDTLFRAFQACAASQGTCNNFTFGSSDSDYGLFGY